MSLYLFFFLSLLFAFESEIPILPNVSVPNSSAGWMRPATFNSGQESEWKNAREERPKQKGRQMSLKVEARTTPDHVEFKAISGPLINLP